ncbi:MAG: hypothetical protein SGBAC_006118 [Bacillariaceae sp.]
MADDEEWNSDCYSDSDEEYLGEDGEDDSDDEEEEEEEEEYDSDDEDEDEDYEDEDDWSVEEAMRDSMAKIEWSKFKKVQSLLRTVNDYLAIYSQLSESGDLVTIGSEGVRKPKHGLTDDEKESWNDLSMEEQYNIMLENAKATIDPMKRVGESLAEEFGAEFKAGPLKGEHRVKQKRDRDYDGDVRRVIDYVRCSLIFDMEDMGKVKEFVDRLRDDESGPYSKEWKLVRVKDGFEKAENFLVGGYRDIKLNLRYKPNGHIIEVQLHLRPYLEVKEKGGHKHYEFARTLQVSGVTEAAQILHPKLLKRGYISSFGQNEMTKLMTNSSKAKMDPRIAKAKVLRNLGDVYSGEYLYGKKAVRCYDRALGLLDKKPMKERHTKVLCCQVLLGMSYAISEIQRHPGRYPTKEKYEKMDVIALTERGLALATDTMGPSHPYTLRFQRIQADQYDSSERFEMALPIYESVLEKMKASLGEDHPETILCKSNFGDALTAQEDDADSLLRGYGLYFDALKGGLKRLGAEHPITDSIVGNIMIVAESDEFFIKYPELKPNLLRVLSNPKWSGYFAEEIEKIETDEYSDDGYDSSEEEEDGDY